MCLCPFVSLPVHRYSFAVRVLHGFQLCCYIGGVSPGGIGKPRTIGARLIGLFTPTVLVSPTCDIQKTSVVHVLLVALPPVPIKVSRSPGILGVTGVFARPSFSLTSFTQG